MSKCGFCKHFLYDCRISILHRAQNEVSLGHCKLDGTRHGDMTLSISDSCDCYEYNEPKYKRGDVLINDQRVIAITNIKHDYNPMLYRVRSNTGGEWSETERRLDEYYKRIWEAKEEKP